MSQSDRMKEWADGLVNNPVGVNDDYGNLVVSLGLALNQPAQQKQHSTQSEQDDPTRDCSEQSGANAHRSKLDMIGFGQGLDDGRSSVRTACETCHDRKVKCNISVSGSPCSNCVKAGRTDCTLHQRRHRNSKPKTNTIPDAQPGATTDRWNTVLQ